MTIKIVCHKLIVMTIVPGSIQSSRQGNSGSRRLALESPTGSFLKVMLYLERAIRKSKYKQQVRRTYTTHQNNYKLIIIQLLCTKI